MKKAFVLLSLIIGSVTLFAYSDSDLDGVIDSKDQCPNTPFMTLVDINGCAKETLKPKSQKSSQGHFDVIMGISYSDGDSRSLNNTDTYLSSLQIDYYYKNFSIQASTAYYYTDGSGYSDNGIYDSFIGASYKMKLKKNLITRVSIGALLPTYDTSLNNNNTDYTASINFSYLFENYTFFGGLGYTLINDDDVSLVDANNNITNVEYQDVVSYNAGIGYYLSSTLYYSIAYNNSTSIYKGYENLQTLTLYGYYSINKHWFSTLTYGYGLSDTASDNYLALKLGYYF